MNSDKKAYLLTFEWDSQKELLEIHSDEQGLEKLKHIIDSLSKTSNCDHTHLMTSDWGGNELSNQKQNPENELINHVKIFKWE